MYVGLFGLEIAQGLLRFFSQSIIHIADVVDHIGILRCHGGGTLVSAMEAYGGVPDAAFSVATGFQICHHIGECDKGICRIFRAVAGMAGDTAGGDGDNRAAEALCCHITLALVAGFCHQAGLGFLGQSDDVILGGAAASFLIAVEEELDGLVPRKQIQLLQGAERHVEVNETALHIIDAGAEGVVILAGEGALLGGPGGKDRVVMPDQQELFRSVPQGSVKMEADIASVDGLDRKAKPLKEPLEVVPTEGFHGGVSIGVGFQVHYVPQNAQELL